MYNGRKVIDVHGHISTPPQFRAFAYNLIALRPPQGGKLSIPDEALAPGLERHLRMMDERDIDVQLLSPRPVGMMHWERPHLVHSWTQVTNDTIAQVCRIHPDRFIGVGQLPQNTHEGCEHCVAELERCVHELGFVGAILNPDPGGDRKAPGVDDRYWYPLYEKAEELQATLVVHPSLTLDPRVEKIDSPYQYNNLTEETLATMLYENSSVFEDFPRLKVVVCHCGGAPRRLLKRGVPQSGLEQERGNHNIVGDSGEQVGGQVGMKAEFAHAKLRDTSDNLFFDTCSYDPHFLTAALRQRGTRQMVFGTEVPGSGSDLANPETGKPCDDVLATIRSFDWLTESEIMAMCHDNPMRVFPLLDGRIA